MPAWGLVQNIVPHDFIAKGMCLNEVFRRFSHACLPSSIGVTLASLGAGVQTRHGLYCWATQREGD